MSPPPYSETVQHLARLAHTLRSDSTYMASVLSAYQDQEKLDDAETARRLSLDVARLPRLALCKRPQSQSERFAEQVRQIASYTGADQVVLAQIIRQVETLDQFRSLPALAPTEAKERPLPSLSGLTAAARDREESTARPTPDDELADKGKPSS